LNHIDRYHLCKTTDKIVLAVSGGVDSMVMLDLFKKSSFNIGVAHCNFQLRGEEANQDEQLVKDTCTKLNIPWFTTRFETARYATEHGLSTQMAARNLRYDFFEEIARKENYQLIATAHNLNDVFETVLLNLTKGTGFEGLTGIPVMNGKIIRPLLFADRKMIEAYAHENKIVWREDASNSSDDYQRNFIRNKVVPSLREINPNLEATFRQTLERVRASSHITKKYIDDFKLKNVSAKGPESHISIVAIQHEPFAAVILWELVKDYGFNFNQCKDIVDDHAPGRKFLSADFELVVDREQYIIHSRLKGQIADVLIDTEHHVVNNGMGSLSIDKRNGTPEIVNDDNVAFLDAEELSFPLLWRKWKNGDAFQPLGMAGEKKVSDFLIDRKVPLHDKENVTVVESGGKIIWVVGFRVSDSCKITEKTKQVLVLRNEKTAGKKNS
jgi:tRNA(Ile)-lysidine synthase